jgi:hypothetical protein
MTETQTATAGRKPIRAPIREGEVQLRAGEYEGRNGEILKRSPFKFGNKFDIPDDVKEAGWSYQWIRHSIYNSTDYSEMSAMKRAGWREVHPDGLKGYFREQTPEGQNCIIDEGLVLVERPAGMTRDAHNEMLMTANKHYEGQIHKIYDETAQLPTGMKSWAAASEFDQEAPQRAPREWQPEHRRGSGEWKPNPRARKIVTED